VWAAPAFVYAGLELYKGSKASKGARQDRRKSGEGSIVRDDSKMERFTVNVFPRQTRWRHRAAFIDQYK